MGTDVVGMNRRTFLAGASIVATTGLSLAARAEDKPDRIIHSGYGGDYGKWIRECYEMPFTAITGIAVDNDIGANPERLTKLRAFRERPRFQIINLQDRFLFEAARDGLLEDIDYTNVPNAADVSSSFKQPQWLSHSADLIGIVFNTDRVKNKPQNWDDLLDDTYKGRIFVDDFNHYGMQIVVAVSMANGGGYHNIKPGLDFIKKIKDRLNPRFISTSQEGAKLLLDGDVDIAMWQSSRVFKMKADGHPIDYVAPTTGDVIISYGNGIVRNSGSKKWCESFLNCTVDPNLQAQFISGNIIEFPSNPKTFSHLSDKVKNLLSRTADDKKFALDYAEVLPRLADWNEAWNKMIAT